MSELVPPVLREQVERAMDAWNQQGGNLAEDWIVPLFAERERVLRSRIEALPTYDGYLRRDDVLGVFDA